MNPEIASRPIDPRRCIGHVDLKLADLEQSLQFYGGVLGFRITRRYGTHAVFILAGGYHQLRAKTLSFK